VNEPAQEILFRPGPSYVVPYITLDLLKTNPNLLKKVIVGPNPNQSRTVRAAEILVREKGYHSDIVSASSIPFNNW
jgi:hypothetical protein